MNFIPRSLNVFYQKMCIFEFLPVQILYLWQTTVSKAKLYAIYQYIVGFSEINLVLNWKTINAYDRLISRVIPRTHNTNSFFIISVHVCQMKSRCPLYLLSIQLKWNYLSCSTQKEILRRKVAIGSDEVSFCLYGN